MSRQDKTRQDKSSQVKSSQVKSSQVKSSHSQCSCILYRVIAESVMVFLSSNVRVTQREYFGLSTVYYFEITIIHFYRFLSKFTKYNLQPIFMSSYIHRTIMKSTCNHTDFSTVVRRKSSYLYFYHHFSHNMHDFINPICQDLEPSLREFSLDLQMVA